MFAIPDLALSVLSTCNMHVAKASGFHGDEEGAARAARNFRNLLGE